ncbi:acylneuraminate cytidylyltransferase [Vibrio lentus]|uniref:acylneuraminate cytidylyltransferase family protein n=1 Tax=Vibrio lentus TaxID=136468 RepID=UPI000C85FFFF|nr:acylneuraminate cytidylyltransferase [Vibrio lentus]MCC4816394.1 acylneuraminate cytidylyltransferase family protein [Vibrio lentus]PMG69733.1 acylneuraminate cytidylyltransferase [Vibrio lentus]PMK90294.1 acylneuraminate cytidylyltransferase [Vibrio lentus]PML20383.1 acylneuraminate cytidylyltransferase [Vibrio lentus]PMM25359.1 acylneuraminate cytidylyltransferase [Vibrio lentus]
MISAFLPCRKGSQRIPNKNVKDFSGIKGGLLKIKLEQLKNCSQIDNIVVSSNDERVLDFASNQMDSRIIIDERPEHLGSNTTTTDELIQYVPRVISEGDVLWTHVTSPFINEHDYSHIILSYKEALEQGFDSLMTVLKIQGFIWDESGPISYERDRLKWPMTQNIAPLYEVDSGAFLTSIINYKKYNDRIGEHPFLYEQSKSKSIDIDWPDDFAIAEKIWGANND